MANKHLGETPEQTWTLSRELVQTWWEVGSYLSLNQSSYLPWSVCGGWDLESLYPEDNGQRAVMWRC